MSFWAVIYHPMEATSGHLIGFLYMFLLLVQGSLFFTRAHVNRWWTLFLEVAVLAHGTLVAIYAPLGWERLTEVARIPMIDYAAVFALAGLIGGALGLIRLISRRRLRRARRRRRAASCLRRWSSRRTCVVGDPMEVAGIEPAS